MKNYRKAEIYCINKQHGKMEFFLRTEQMNIYLFTANYFSQNIFDTYRNGQNISTLFRNTRSSRQQRLKERIVRTCKYIETEYQMQVFENSRKQKPVKKTGFCREMERA